MLVRFLVLVFVPELVSVLELKFVQGLAHTSRLEFSGLLLADIGHNTIDFVAPFRFMSSVSIGALTRRFNKLVDHSDKLVIHFACTKDNSLPRAKVTYITVWANHVELMLADH